MINGNDILIADGSSLIAAAKSGEIQADCETIEVSSPSTGEWQTFLKGRKSWSITISYLLSAVGDLAKVLTVGNTYTLTVTKRGESSASLTGTAILTTCKQTYTRGNLCAGTFQFKGTGALT
jgi:predicted secreted protein